MKPYTTAMTAASVAVTSPLKIPPKIKIGAINGKNACVPILKNSLPVGFCVFYNAKTFFLRHE